MDKLMDDAIKTKKKAKRRKTDVDLEKMDDEAVDNLRMKMIEAANADTEAIEAGNPATSKLSMVDEVRDTLGRQNLLNIAVDCGILRGIRRWLEPLPNKTLPAYNVQKLMFEILAKLKPDIVHLRESGIGRIVMFYTKDSRPQRLIKREAEKLVRDWSRPILGRSDDYRSRAIPVADGRSSAPYVPSYPIILDNTLTHRRSSQRRKSVDDTKHSALAAPVKDTGRARVMMPQSHSYEVAPVSRLNNVVGPIRPITARGDEFIRKMKAKKAARR
jgi:transcription factor SPN1